MKMSASLGPRELLILHCGEYSRKDPNAVRITPGALLRRGAGTDLKVSFAESHISVDKSCSVTNGIV